MASDATPKVKRDVEQAETGDAAAAAKVETAQIKKPAAAEAAEQELAEGPEGRGLSR